MNKQCCVDECRQTKYQTELRVFEFPKEENLRKKWIQNCGFDEQTFQYECKIICEKHFEEQCLIKRKLRAGSLPTLNLGAQEIVHSCNLKPYLLSGNKCSVCHISKRSHPSISFYRFPSNKEAASLWIKACNFNDKFDIKNKIICGRHFEPHFLLGARMPKGAVPSLNLINDPLTISKQQKSVFEIEKEYFTVSDSCNAKNFGNNFFLENAYKSTETSVTIKNVTDLKIKYEIDVLGEQVEQFEKSRSSEANSCTLYSIERAKKLEYAGLPETSKNSFSVEQTCRACLKNGSVNDTMIKIFANNIDSLNVELSHEFKYMTLEVTPNDGLPQVVCVSCMKQMCAIRKFRQICKNSQDILKTYFTSQEINIVNSAEVDFISDIDIKAEDCTIEFLNMEHIDECTSRKRLGIENNDKIFKETKEIEIIKEEQFELVNISNTINELECDICNERNFKGKVALLMHMKDIHIGKKNKIITKSECNICNESFINKVKLQSHIFSTHKNTVRCQKCKIHFAELKDLKQHESDKGCIAHNTKCRFCKSTFNSSHDYEAHLRDVHFISRRNCPICHKSISRQYMAKHQQIHDKNQPCKCEECGLCFRTDLLLRRHFKGVHAVTNHECPHCKKQFFNSVKFKYHLKTHDPNKKYKCKYCDKAFIQSHHLTAHERIHTNSKPFLCNICGKSFNQNGSLNQHMQTHGESYLYSCEICDKGFHSKESVKLHMRVHCRDRTLKNNITINQCDDKDIEARYQCDYCGKDFSQKFYLKVHLSKHTGEKPYECEICNKTFNLYKSLKYHQYTHTAPEIIYPYCCSICNKRFKFQQLLSKHMDKHNEERNHVCTYCGDAFKQIAHLRIHVKSIHVKDPKKFSCIVCNKAYTRKCTLNAHMKFHSNAKPYDCNHCGKNFRFPKDLTVHMRIHTGEKPYSCDLCNQSFRLYSVLERHAMKHAIDNIKKNI